MSSKSRIIHFLVAFVGIGGLYGVLAYFTFGNGDLMVSFQYALFLGFIMGTYQVFGVPRVKQWAIDFNTRKLKEKIRPSLEKENIQFFASGLMKFGKTRLEGILTLTQENFYFHSRKRFHNQNVIQLSLDQISSTGILDDLEDNFTIKTSKDDWLFTIKDVKTLKTQIDNLKAA